MTYNIYTLLLYFCITSNLLFSHSQTGVPFLHFAFPFTDTEQFDSPERSTISLYLTFPLKTPITIIFPSERVVQAH
jgi:hypothetical protein